MSRPSASGGQTIRKIPRIYEAPRAPRQRPAARPEPPPEAAYADENPPAPRQRPAAESSRAAATAPPPATPAGQDWSAEPGAEAFAIHLFRDVTTSHEVEALVRERLAQAQPPAPPDGAPPPELTRREIEVLRLITSGANTRTMAERLHVSPATVRNHVQHILGKLGVHSRLEATAYATRHRLL